MASSSGSISSVYRRRTTRTSCVMPSTVFGLEFLIPILGAEHDPSLVPNRVALPQDFVSRWGHRIDTEVALIDPIGTCWSVKVLRNPDGTVYFSRGWERIKRCYNIENGTTVAVKYLDPATFEFKIYGPSNLQVEYDLLDDLYPCTQHLDL